MAELHDKYPGPADEEQWSGPIPTGCKGMGIYDCGCSIVCPLHQAAPKLLEALRALSDALTISTGPKGKREGAIQIAWEVARAAIREATGQGE